MAIDGATNAAFLSALASLASRLLAKRIAIYRVEYDYSHFGSWTLVAGSRHKRVKLDWDGKESYLAVSTALFSDAQSPPAWKSTPGHQFAPDASIDDEMLFALVEKLV